MTGIGTGSAIWSNASLTRSSTIAGYSPGLRSWTPDTWASCISPPLSAGYGEMSTEPSLSWRRSGVGDGREGDRPVSGTMADGSQGLAAADDSDGTPCCSHTPGAGAVVRHPAAGAGLDGRGDEALERDPHTIGRWASAFGEGGPAALIFEQTGGSPPPLTRRSRRS